MAEPTQSFDKPWTDPPEDPMATDTGELFTPHREAEKEKEFAESVAKTIYGGIGAGVEGVKKVPFGAGSLAKFLRKIKDGPQKPIEVAEEPVPPMGPPGEVVQPPNWVEAKSSTTWREYDYDPKTGKPRSATEWTEKDPEKRTLKAYIRDEGPLYSERIKKTAAVVEQAVKDLNQGKYIFPERFLLHLYPFIDPMQPSMEELQKRGGEIVYEDVPYGYSTYAADRTGQSLDKGSRPMPKLAVDRRSRKLEEHWDKKREWEEWAITKQSEVFMRQLMDDGVPWEDAVERSMSAGREVLEFAKENENEEANRAGLSKDAAAYLNRLEAEGSYPYERLYAHSKAAKEIKKQTETLKNAFKSGDLAAARKSIDAVIALRKKYRESQIDEGLSVVVQPRELHDFEDELTSYRKFKMRLQGDPRLHKDSLGAVPPNPLGHMIESGEYYPTDYREQLKRMEPYLTRSIPGSSLVLDAAKYFFLEGPESRAKLGLTHDPQDDPRSLHELTMRVEGMQKAGLDVSGLEHLIRPIWARSNDLKQYGYTKEQADEIEAMAKANNMDPMDMAHHLLFPDQLDPHMHGMAVPADAFERYGLGANPWGVAIGAISEMAKVIRDADDAYGTDDYRVLFEQAKYRALGLNYETWREHLEWAADIVPEDPAKRDTTDRSGMASLYFGEKLVGLSNAAYFETRDKLKVVFSDLPMHQFEMYSYMGEHAHEADDIGGLSKLLAESEAIADNKYPSIAASKDDLQETWDRWTSGEPSEEWLERGADDTMAQVMALAMFPIDILDLAQQGASLMLGPAKTEEVQRFVAQTAMGLLDPVAQTFLNFRHTWEHHGWLMTSLNALMVRKPVVRRVGNFVDTYVKKLSDGKPVEVRYGDIRPIGEKPSQKATKDIEASLKGELAEIANIKNEMKRDKAFLELAQKSDGLGALRKDSAGRHYLFREDKRVYIDELKVADDGTVYWEETISPEAKLKAQKEALDALDPVKPEAELASAQAAMDALESKAVESGLWTKESKVSLGSVKNADGSIAFPEYKAVYSRLRKAYDDLEAKPAPEATPAQAPEPVVIEVGRMPPNHPDMVFNTPEGFINAKIKRHEWLQRRLKKHNKLIKEFTDQLAEDYVIGPNPAALSGWPTGGSAKDLGMTDYYFKRKDRATGKTEGLEGFETYGKKVKSFDSLKRGVKSTKKWTKIKVLRALPIIAELVLGGPVFGTIEATGLILNRLLGGASPGPLQAWARYMFRSPEVVVPAVVRLLEYETGWTKRTYAQRLQDMLHDTPEKHWDTLSDILHGEAEIVTFDAARVNSMTMAAVSRAKASGASPQEIQQIREAAGRLNERAKSVKIEKLVGGEPKYPDAVQRGRAIRYNQNSKKFEVDPDIRKIAPQNLLNDLDGMVDVGNRYGKRWADETVKLTNEAIELGMFDNPGSLRRVYWPQTYESASKLRKKVRQVLSKEEKTAKQKRKEIEELVKGVKEEGMSSLLTTGQLRSNLRRLGVPIEKRADFGLRRGGDAFKHEALSGLFELKNAVETRKLYRRIIQKHPELWRTKKTKGFTEVSLADDGAIKLFGDIATAVEGVPGTSGKVWLQSDLWKHLSQMEAFKRELNWWYPKMLNFWKGMRTHRHAPTVFRNFLTNKLLFEPMAGIEMTNPANLKYWRMAIEDFKNYAKSARFRESLASGTFEGTWSKVEVSRAQVAELIDMLYPNLHDFKAPMKNVFGSFFSVGMRYSKGVGRVNSKTGNMRPLGKDVKALVWDLPGVVYSLIDDLPRHVYRIKRTEELVKAGRSRKQAVHIATKEARHKFIDYENVPGFVQYMRSPLKRPGPLLTYVLLGQPFLAFSARAVPMFWDWMRTDPIRATSFLNLHDHLTNLAYANEGITHEEMKAYRQVLPSHMREGHKPLRGSLRRRDRGGRTADITADLFGASWLNPFAIFGMQSDLTDTPSLVRAALNLIGPGDPMFGVAWSLMKSGEQKRLGPGGIETPVWKERRPTESLLGATARQFGDIGNYVYQSIISPSFPGGSLWNQTISAFDGVPDQYGRIQTVKEVMSRWVGLFVHEDVSAEKRILHTLKELRKEYSKADKASVRDDVKKTYGLKSFSVEGLQRWEQNNPGRPITKNLKTGKPAMPDEVIEAIQLGRMKEFIPRLKIYYRKMAPFVNGQRETQFPAAGASMDIVDQLGLPHDQARVHRLIMKRLEKFERHNWKYRADRHRLTEGLAWSEVVDLFVGTEADIGLTGLLSVASKQISLEEEFDVYDKASKALGDKALSDAKKKGYSTRPPLKVRGFEAQMNVGTVTTKKLIPGKSRKARERSKKRREKK